MRIYGRKEARRGSFLGNEAISDSSRDHFCATVRDQYIPAAYTHIGPLSFVHYLVVPPPLCLFLAFPFARFVTRRDRSVVQHGKRTGTPLSFLPPSPFIAIHAFYGPCYIDRPANNRDTLYSATRRLTTDRAEYRSL